MISYLEMAAWWLNLSSSSSSESRFMFIASATSLLTSLHNDMHKFVFYLRPTIHSIHIGIIECLSLSRNWVPPTLPASECAPPWTRRGEQHSLAGAGWGTQCGRLDRKPDTLNTPRSYPSRFGRPCFCIRSYGCDIYFKKWKYQKEKIFQLQILLIFTLFFQTKMEYVPYKGLYGWRGVGGRGAST